MKTPIRVAVTAVAVACAGAAFGTVLNGAVGSDNSGPDDPVVYPAEKSSPREKLSEKTVTGMKRAKTDVDVLDPGATDTRLDAKEAIHEASAQASFLANAHVGETGLGSITVNDYGTMLDGDPGKPSKLNLHIKDRQAWIVVFDGFTMPMFGPVTDPEAQPTSLATSAEPESGKSTMYVLIDAKTGEFLGARSLLNAADTAE